MNIAVRGAMRGEGLGRGADGVRRGGEERAGPPRAAKWFLIPFLFQGYQ
jgi:hypothetical protein